MAFVTFTNKIKLTMYLLLAACMTAAAASLVGNEAVYNICSTTDFKESCHKSLAGAAGTQPKDLIKAALDAALVELESVVKMASSELIVCEEVLNAAIYDVRRSSEKVEKIEIGRLSFNIADVRTWLSAAVSIKENCIDELNSNTGQEVVEKVESMLQISNELLSNSLAMITNTEPHLLGHDEENPNLDTGFVTAAAPPRTVTVSKKIGSGDFTTINDALKSLPQKNSTPVVVFVKAGTYKEHVMIPKGMNNVTLIGEGPLITIISGDRSNAAGYSTSDSATLAVEGEGFFAKGIKIENTAPASQAVAVRVKADRAVFHNVHFDGHQDTLYAQHYRQFYRDCRISGTVDFIFGDATAVFQNCDIVVRRPNLKGKTCTVTAQGRTLPTGATGTVIQGCRITEEEDLLHASPPVTSYLGRPWRQYSRTVIMQSDIGGFISPAGWLAWQGNDFNSTVYYANWCNTGGGAKTSTWVNWPGLHNLTMATAESFTARKMFGDDGWIKQTRVPYAAGLLLPVQPNC